MTQGDYRALEFFHFCTVSCFGTRASDFLRHAAYGDASVRLAATALGSLHRTFVSETGGFVALTPENTRYALKQYNAAIHQALKMLPGAAEQRNDAVLIMCALFYCFESLQGHFNNAIQHGIAGLRILKHLEYQGQAKGVAVDWPPVAIRSMFMTIENQMLEIDWEMYIPASVQLTLLSPPRLPCPALADTPCTLEEISDSFESIYNQCLKFLYLSSMPVSLDETRVDPELASDLHRIQAHYDQVKGDINAWSGTFDRYLMVHSTKGSDLGRQRTILYLQLWRIAMDILLRMEAPISDSSWDDFCTEFGAIVSISEKIIDSTLGACYSQRPIQHELPSSQQSGTFATILPKPQPPPPASVSFVVSLGMVPLLWLVATSCRQSQLRRRAIDLMKRSRRREGVWDSAVFAALAEKIVRMEEEAAGIEHGMVYEAADLPVSARVTTVAGRFCEGRQGKIEYFREGVKLGEDVIRW
ncbi:putative C6 transcription factor [Aspergillus clavatus NRRL 1]|uniref:C6 transcription factor, putative n=1 Tax=Aspergillus clavatus (strain ATCC 1007 / CBS 513.65 / DSM 816 / NCTC 3887 / NRRL 1 / QM 1276 / 107) TaxID=344612 RepID=A1C898_ASPCL|nr:C6 transcription factor, putative [Aspergillus clavatus NRRL 1]EAW14619.1 C6 transcription factor, putative [Aspergillus clavatus NRRL 1]